MSLCDECGGDYGHSAWCPVPKQLDAKRRLEHDMKIRMEACVNEAVLRGRLEERLAIVRFFNKHKSLDIQWALGMIESEAHLNSGAEVEPK